MVDSSGQLTVCLVSLGCPKNLIDSERMLADLAQAGCIVGAPMNDANVIVVNTCGFLASARDEALGIIEEALSHKRAGRTQRVVVAGCLPSRDGAALKQALPEVDAIIGVENRADVVSAVVLPKPFVRIDAHQGGVNDDTGRFRLTPPHTAYLRIAEGCSGSCTYCTIPAIRGPFRSKPAEAVLAEARELVNDGAVELNVIAQETTNYGQDLSNGPTIRTLSGLLTALNKLDGLEWIRLMYTHPRRFTDDLIDTIATCHNVLPYVDIPLQHISNDILRRMGRSIGRRDTETLLNKLRRQIPGIVIRTTFIVGFPGETDDHFDELLQFVKDFHFDALGVFEFSPEPGTAAAEMQPTVPQEVIVERAERIMLAQQEVAFQANGASLGKEVTVLIDGIDESGHCIGRHYGQAPEIDSVCFVEPPIDTGSIVSGKVIDFDGYDLVVSVRHAKQI